MTAKRKKIFISGIILLFSFTLTSFLPMGQGKANANVYDKNLLIKITDIVKIKKSIMGAQSLSEYDRDRLDLNNDGSVNILDMSNAVNAVIYNKKPSVIKPPSPLPSVYRIDMSEVLQEPELPTGCEVTALTMLLNYYGFGTSKTALADMMPQLNFYYLNDILYGADFKNIFPGNPRKKSGYGCYAPCMVKTAENYFNFVGNKDYYLSDISDTDFDLLLNYVAADIPVMAWATMGMIEPYKANSWMTPSGNRVTWIANEHSLIITGYDKTNDIVFVNDPLKGKVTYTKSLFKHRYEQMGKNAVVLLKKSEPFDPGADGSVTPPPITPKKYEIGDDIEYTGNVYYSSFGGSSVWISGTYTITEIVDDETRPYRIRLGREGWIPYEF